MSRFSVIGLALTQTAAAEPLVVVKSAVVGVDTETIGQTGTAAGVAATEDEDPETNKVAEMS